jgi:outer membrane protein OmpA-like peptidoglycan-associated protein
VPVRPYEILEVLLEGKTNYYRIHQKVLLKADFQGAYSSNRKYDEFDHQVSYFYLEGEQRIPFKFNQSALKKAFPKKADAIAKFTKQNKTDFKNDADCIELLKFIDE